MRQPLPAIPSESDRQAAAGQRNGRRERWCPLLRAIQRAIEITVLHSHVAERIDQDARARRIGRRINALERVQDRGKRPATPALGQQPAERRLADPIITGCKGQRERLVADAGDLAEHLRRTGTKRSRPVPENELQRLLRTLGTLAGTGQEGKRGLRPEDCGATIELWRVAQLTGKTATDQRRGAAAGCFVERNQSRQCRPANPCILITDVLSKCMNCMARGDTGIGKRGGGASSVARFANPQPIPEGADVLVADLHQRDACIR